jgi:hypothetical protein
MLNEMWRLRQSNKEFPCDVAVVCEGGAEALAHGLILSAMCPVFNANLQPGRFAVEKDGAVQKIDLGWANATTMELALKFAYASSKRSSLVRAC